MIQTYKPSLIFRRHTDGWWNSLIVKKRALGDHLWTSVWVQIMDFVQGECTGQVRGSHLHEVCVRQILWEVAVLLIEIQRVLLLCDRLFLGKHYTCIYSFQIGSAQQMQVEIGPESILAEQCVLLGVNYRSRDASLKLMPAWVTACKD